MAGREWEECTPHAPDQLTVEIVLPVLFLTMMLMGYQQQSLSLYLTGTLPVWFVLCIWMLYVHKLTQGLDTVFATGLWLLLTLCVIKD